MLLPIAYALLFVYLLFYSIYFYFVYFLGKEIIEKKNQFLKGK